MKYLGWLLAGLITGLMMMWFWQDAQWKKRAAEWEFSRDSVIAGVEARADSLSVLVEQADSSFIYMMRSRDSAARITRSVIGASRERERTLRDSLTVVPTLADSARTLMALVETTTIRADSAERLAGYFEEQAKASGTLLALTRQALATSDSSRQALLRLVETVPKEPASPRKLLGFLSPPRPLVGLGAAVDAKGKVKPGLVLGIGFVL